MISIRSHASWCGLLAISLAACRPEGAAETGASSILSEEQKLRNLCTGCHLFPPPDTLPKARWGQVVREMFELARAKAGELGGVPTVEYATRFYEERAPAVLPSLATSAQSSMGLHLRRRPLSFPGWDDYPAVANVQLVPVTHPRLPDLLFTDMRRGGVFLLRPPRSGREPELFRVGDVPHPAHAKVTDLDGDGKLDVVVANLGTLTPSDATNGSVECFYGRGDMTFEPRTLLEGLGRVADVRDADFDGDGDLDLIVAVFGWRNVGEILYMENRGPTARPVFAPKQIDARPGGIHVPPHDVNGDGHMDFVALFAQQHECVVAFLGDGRGGFKAHDLFRAPHPGWGATGIDWADLDGDGDRDLLLTNGDTLDDLVVKPYHGLQWLENQGNMQFELHLLTQLYGAHFAQAGDLDGDGDQDIVTCAFLPYIRQDTPGVEHIESLLWLEQTSPGRFTRHPIETRTPYHPTICLGDIDGDGDLDIFAGNFTMANETTDTIDHAILFLENELR